MVKAMLLRCNINAFCIVLVINVLQQEMIRAGYRTK